MQVGRDFRCRQIRLWKKIQDGGGRHLENSLHGHNSVAVTRIHTVFGTGIKSDVMDTEIPSNNLISPKPKMAALRRFENT